jgi:DNA-binding NarL/FixJ family response regulator
MGLSIVQATKTRVLLADDNEQLREKVAEVLTETCEIVASVANGRAAVYAGVQHQPQIVLMDISMPVMNGIEASGYLLRAHKETKIIFLTVHDDPDFVQAALDAGASGYVIKSRMVTDLIPAIRAVLEGRRFISKCLSDKNAADSKTSRNQ